VNWYVSGTVGNVGQINITARNTGQVGATAQYIAQPLDSDQIVPLQGKYVTATIRVGTGPGWVAAAVAVQLYVGTGAPAKRGAGFTGETQVINQNFATPANMATTTFSATSGAPVPVNATQGEIRLLWNPVGTAIAGEALYLLNVQLEAGPQFSGFEYRPAAVELGICQRFYQKSFPLATQPAQNVAGGSLLFTQSGGASFVQYAPLVYYPTRLRAVPALTSFNPSAANAQIRSISLALDYSATTVGQNTEAGFSFYGTTPAGSAAGQLAGVHWTADAEI
jgi:hypothetical protein